MMDNSREIDLLNCTEAEKQWLNNINGREGCNYRMDTMRATAVRTSPTRSTPVRKSPPRATAVRESPARATPARPIPETITLGRATPARTTPARETPYTSMTMKEREKPIHISEQDRVILEFENPIESEREHVRRDVKEKVDLETVLCMCCVLCCVEDIFMTCSACLALTLIFLFFLIAPGVMLYVGITYQYCEDIFTVWLILGGVLCYVNFIMAIVYIYAKTTQSPKTKWRDDRGVYRSGLITLCIFSVITVIWWVFGFGRVFAPARSYMRNPSSWESGSKGILGEDWMEDADCKQFLFDFPFWLTLCPFMFMGLFFLFIFILAFLHCLGCDGDD